METLQKEALESALAEFVGSQNWYSHYLAPAMLCTDGVQYFAEQTESYWLLDIIATVFFPMRNEQPFLLITVESKNGSCDIVVENGDGQELVTMREFPAALIEGIWKFYLYDNVLLLPSEY